MSAAPIRQKYKTKTIKRSSLIEVIVAGGFHSADIKSGSWQIIERLPQGKSTSVVDVSGFERVRSMDKTCG